MKYKKIILFMLFFTSIFYIKSYSQNQKFKIKENSKTNTTLPLTKEEKEFLKLHPKIRVSNEIDWPPFDFIEGDQPTGFSIDLVKLLAKKIGVKIQFINGYSWNQLEQLFKKREIDVLHCVYKTDARKKYGLYTQQYYSAKNYFIIESSKPDIKSPKQLYGKTVAIPRGWATEKYLRTYHPNINILPVQNVFESFKAVDNGKADAAIELKTIAKYQINKYLFTDLRISNWFKEYDNKISKGLYFLIRKDWPVLHRLFEKALKSTSLKEIKTLKSKWIEKNKTVHLSKEEQTFLKKNPVITLGTDKSWEPYVIVDEKGNTSGYDVEILNRINQMTGANFQIKPGIWQEMIEKVKKKEIDGLSTGAVHKERTNYLNFSNVYCSVKKMVLVSKNNSKNILSKEDLAGKTIIYHRSNLSDKKNTKKFPKSKIITADSIEEVIKSVITGKADAAIGSGSYIYKSFKMDLPYLQIAFFIDDEKLNLVFGIRKDWPEAISILNKGLDLISNNERLILLNKWFNFDNLDDKGIKKISLTDKERRYLENRGPIKMCGDPNWMPYEKINNNIHKGIIADFIKTFEKRIGKKIELVPTKSWSQSIEYAKSRKCDILSAAAKTPNRSKYMGFTTSYLSFPNVIATKNNVSFIENIEYILDKKFCAIKNYAVIEILKERYPNINIVEVKNPISGMDKVQNGEVYGFIDALPSISYIIQEKNLFELKIAGKLDFTMNLSIAVRKDDPILLNIFQKAINLITEDEKRKIYNKWISVKYMHSFDYSLFWKIVLGIVLILVFIFYWNRKLSNEIKQRKIIEFSLKKSEENQRRLISNTPGIIYRCKNDKNWTMIFISDFVENLIGYPSSDFINNKIRSFKSVIHKDDKKRVEKTIKNAISEKKNYSLEYRLFHKKGTLKWVYEKGLGIYNESDQIQFLDGFIFDITEKKIAEEKLQKSYENLKIAKIEAEKANNTKSEFLANMSHELRTPLNAVIGFSELLSSMMIDKKQKSYVQSIKLAGRNLLTLINDILDLSKIEAGMLEIKPGIVNIKNIMKEMEQIFINKIEKKNIDFYIEIEQEIPSTLILDEVRIRQVLLNLIGNAIKFTEKGYIKVKINKKIVEGIKDQLDLIIIVEDSGIGIAEKDIGSIFESFKQHDGLDTRKYGGTGLGLAICKKLINSMGGEIRVKSKINKGSVFKIVLKNVPINLTKNEVKSKEKLNLENTLFEAATVLVVDDIAYCRNIMEEMLPKIGFKVILAENGKIALDILRQKKIDLIFMDLRMPVMDGIETTKKIKEDKKIKNIPVIALTASSSEDNKEKVLKKGFNEFLNKPFKIEDLLSILSKYFKYSTRETEKSEFTKNIFNINRLKDPEELINSLNKKILPECSNQKEVMIMSKIKELGEEVKKIAQKYNVSELEAFGKRIIINAENFDTVEIAKEIKLLAIQINEINSVWEKSKIKPPPK